MAEDWFFAGADLEPGKLDYTQIEAKELQGRHLTLTGFTKGNPISIVKLTESLYESSSESFQYPYFNLSQLSMEKTAWHFGPPVLGRVQDQDSSLLHHGTLAT